MTGNLLFHSYSADPGTIKRENGSTIKVGEIRSDNRVINYFGINPGADHSPFAHDMMLTKRYMVIYDSSVWFHPEVRYQKFVELSGIRV